MTRQILSLSQIHPSIQAKVVQQHLETLNEVQAAVASHDVVVVGMRTNPVVSKARKALDAINIAHHDLDYGNYFNNWRKRNVLKMWTGWPTFPMVFVKGVLVGGADDLKLLIESGELAKMLQQPK
jgi:glutaredoxin-related protein